MLYPQNGDRIVAIDYVSSLHPMYTTDFKGVLTLATGMLCRL